MDSKVQRFERCPLFREKGEGPANEEPTPTIVMAKKGPTLETLDFTIRIGSTPSFFTFRFVSLLCLRRTLRLYHQLNSE